MILSLLLAVWCCLLFLRLSIVGRECVVSMKFGLWSSELSLRGRLRAAIYLGSSGCQRTETFGFCALYWELVEGWKGVRTGEVFWLYHSSRSAKSTSKL